MITLRRKLPAFNEVLSVYATIVFLVYGWAGITFLWRVPSWLFFLTPLEIISILSYTLLSCLWESTLLLLIFLVVGLMLPSSFLFARFVQRGSTIIILLTFWMILFNLNTLVQLPTMNDLVTFGILISLTIGLALIIVDRVPVLKKFLVALTDRLIIFLYVWLPFSAVAILIVVIRLI